jgi:hypothetical protein
MIEVVMMKSGGDSCVAEPKEGRDVVSQRESAPIEHLVKATSIARPVLVL